MRKYKKKTTFDNHTIEGSQAVADANNSPCSHWNFANN
jgi:hypothetical protein